MLRLKRPITAAFTIFVATGMAGCIAGETEPPEETAEQSGELSFKLQPKSTFASTVKAIGEGKELCGYDEKGARSCASIDRQRAIQSSTVYDPSDDLEICATNSSGGFTSCSSEPDATIAYKCDEETGYYCGCNGWVDCVNMLVFACDSPSSCDPDSCPPGGDYDCCCTAGVE
jgi:hypothetical protein